MAQPVKQPPVQLTPDEQRLMNVMVKVAERKAREEREQADGKAEGE